MDDSTALTSGTMSGKRVMLVRIVLVDLRRRHGHERYCPVSSLQLPVVQRVHRKRRTKLQHPHPHLSFIVQKIDGATQI